MNKWKLTGLLASFLLLASPINAQLIDKTGFENFTDEHEFVKNDWTKEGFNPLWVDGFDQKRCFIDDAFAKNGLKSLRVKYPTGGVGPSETGAQVPLNFSPKDEVYVSYWLRFSDDFDWGGTNEGGKLPGLGSGDNCSGGASCNGTNGFSSRLMWRTGGKAVLYFYHMDKPATYGEDIDLLNADKSPIVFEKGKWYQVAQRVKINTGNNYNAEVDVWINGEKALSLTGYRLVNNGDKIDNFYFSTFHGGSGVEWAPGNDCHIWYDDIVVSTNPSDVFATICKKITFPNLKAACPGLTQTIDIGLNDQDYTVNWYKRGQQGIYSIGSKVNIQESGLYTAERYNESCVPIMDSIYILPAQLLSVVSDTICKAGNATVSVNGSQSYNWYTSVLATTVSATGKNYQANITKNTTFWVEENKQQQYKLGRSNQTGITWNTSNFDAADKRHVLTNSIAVKIDAVTINSTNVNNVINLRILAADEVTVLHEVKYTVVNAGMNRIPLGIDLTPGTYKFDLVGSSKSVHYETENSNYPISIPNVLKIDCNVDYQCTSGWHGFFYDWEFSVNTISECRTPAEAIIDSNHKDCVLTSIDQNATKSIDIYPNPTNGYLQLTKSTVWEVYNSQGVKVKEGTGTQVDISASPKGMYFLKTGDTTTPIYHH